MGRQRPSITMRFDLKKPCKNCPFLKASVQPANKGWLSKGRAQGIIDSLLYHGGTFPCHKTTRMDDEFDHDLEYASEEAAREAEKEAWRRNVAGSQYCAGALILMLKCGNPSQMTQFAQRLNFFNEEELIDRDKVVENLEEFVNMHDHNLS